MKHPSTTPKKIYVKNGCVEIIKPQEDNTRGTDIPFYKFLAKLLIEDKHIQTKE